MRVTALSHFDGNSSNTTRVSTTVKAPKAKTAEDTTRVSTALSKLSQYPELAKQASYVLANADKLPFKFANTLSNTAWAMMMLKERFGVSIV